MTTEGAGIRTAQMIKDIKLALQELGRLPKED
jgi:hypothetical protein